MTVLQVTAAATVPNSAGRMVRAQLTTRPAAAATMIPDQAQASGRP
jgi:hypothetical protein